MNAFIKDSHTEEHHELLLEKYTTGPDITLPDIKINTASDLDLSSE